MAALRDLVLGLAVAHFAWLWFWLCGSVVRRPDSDHEHNEYALLDVVLTTVTGIALTGIVTFALGLCGALRPITGVFAVCALPAVLLMRGDSLFAADFWTRRCKVIAHAASPGLLVVYFIAIVLAFPAIVPDNGSDATAFYLAQALDYANSHKLVVDPWFRFPYYPNNWVLIETWPAVFGLGPLGQFVNWLCGCLTLFGVYGLIVYGAREVRGAAGMRGIRAIAIAGALSLALTATFDNVVDIGMIDVPSTLFFLTTLIATLVGLRESGSSALAGLVLCAGFLVGMKISFIALIPLFVGLCWVIAGRTRAPSRHLTIATLVLLAVAAPWYVRALVLAGDPIAPILNLRLHGVDPIFSRVDWAFQLEDLRSDSRPWALLTLPLQLFSNFQAPNVRDFGTALIVVLIPLPLMYVAWAIFRRRVQSTPLLITAACVTYAYGYWITSSHLGRYALIFIPCLIGFVAMLVAQWTSRSVPVRYAGVAIMGLLACPSMASWNVPPKLHTRQTLSDIWQYKIAGVGLYYTGANTWLEQQSPAYVQIEDVAHLLRRARRPDLRVYVLGLGGSQYFFKQHGVTMIGEAFGPARFRDLNSALLRDELQAYIARFNIGAFVVPRDTLDSGPAYAQLPEQLHALGWWETRYPHSDWLLFTTPVIPAPRFGEGHPPP